MDMDSAIGVAIGVAVILAIIVGTVALAVIDVHACGGTALHYAHGRCVA